MSQFIYCECGAKTTQTTSLVKFCSSCGEPFLKTSASKTQKQSRFKEKIEEVDEEDDDDSEEDDDYEETSHYRPRKNYNSKDNPIIIEDLAPNRGVKISEIAGRTQNVEKLPPGKKISAKEKKQTLAEIQRDGGTLRKKV